jgi:tRNA pseudouridine32 synthase/23S rRNA pseudouridine746 synthase
MPTTALITNDIDVLYQDEHLLIVNKAANLLTVPGRGIDKQDCLINRLIKPFPDARIVHRLDMATSGIVVTALSHTAQAAMGDLFAQRQIQKIYIALVAGKLKKTGTVDLPLLCDWDNRPKQKVDLDHG